MVLLGGIKSFVLQVIMLYERDVKLSIRRWYSTLIRIILPSLFIFLFWIISAIILLNSNTALTEIKDKIPHCSKNTIYNTPGKACHTVAYFPCNDTEIYAFMSRVATDNGFTIAPFNDCGKQGVDIVGFTDYFSLNKFYSANYFDLSIAIGWFRDPITNLPQYVLQQISAISDPFSSAGNTLSDISLETQRACDQAIISESMKQLKNLTSFDVSLDPSYYSVFYTWQQNNGFQYSSIGDLIWTQASPVVVYLSVFVHVILTTQSINFDKESLFFQGLMIMGLQRGPYWTAWFFIQLTLAFFSSWVTVGVGLACQMKFFLRTNIVVSFLFFFVASAYAIGISLGLTALIHRPGINNMMMVLIFLGITGLTWGAQMDGFSAFPLWAYFWYSPPVTFIGLLTGPINIGKMLHDINALVFSKNETITGFGFADMFKPIGIDPALGIEGFAIPFTFTNVIFTFLCGVLGLLLAWYFDNVSPGDQKGVPQGCCFCCSCYFWGAWVNDEPSMVLQEFNNQNQNSVLADMDEDIFEEYNETMKKSIAQEPTAILRILKLSKTFLPAKCCGCCACCQTTDVEVRALDNLTVYAERGQILTLLGHNGAGKTSTINILTGLTPPVSGDAFLFERSIRSAVPFIQKRIGVCAQHDILWPELSAYEHLKIFCQLKQLDRSTWDETIMRHLEEVKLVDKKDERVGTYSGGMKRRLSVAIASVGDPEIIFLDEPTTGLDPGNKIHLWSIIQKLKVNRLVFLTTHSMEEADYLSDKIVMLGAGRTRAVGTSSHLKNRYGAGYHIHLVTKPDDLEALKLHIQSKLPDAVCSTEETSGNLTYTLPLSRLDLLQQFFFFLELELQSSSTLIVDWNISKTTLEEVFVRLTHGDAHTFKSKEERERVKDVELQCNVYFNDRIIGTVLMTHKTPLRFVRKQISIFENFDVSNYVFLGADFVEIPLEMEEKIPAINYYPSIIIKESGVANNEKERANILVIQNFEMKLDMLLRENEQLKEELRRKDELLSEYQRKYRLAVEGDGEEI